MVAPDSRYRLQREHHRQDRRLGSDREARKRRASPPAQLAASTWTWASRVGWRATRTNRRSPSASASGPSQRALVDCDPRSRMASSPTRSDRAANGLPTRATSSTDFPNDCPWGDNTPGTFFDLPKPAPFDDSGAIRLCPRQDNQLGGQIDAGFNQRFFTNTPYNCPPTTGRRIRGGGTTGTARTTRTTAHVQMGRRRQSPPRSRHQFPSRRPAAVNLFFTPTILHVLREPGSGLVGFGASTSPATASTSAGGGPWPGGDRRPLRRGQTRRRHQRLQLWAGNDPPPDMSLRQASGSSGGTSLKDAPRRGERWYRRALRAPTSFNPCVPVLIE